MILAIQEGFVSMGMYSVLFWLQVIIYIAAVLGWLFENRSTRIKLLFVPYYFMVMNYSVCLGFLRYINNNQSVNWERAKRAVQ